MEQITTKQITKPKIALTPILITNITLSIISFFVGRVVIFQSLNPLTPAFLGCLCFTGSNFYVSVIFSFLGLLTRADITCFSKYIIFLALMFIVNVALPNAKREKSGPLRCAVSSTAILISGLIYAVINSFSFYYTVLAILETILTFSLAMVLDRGVQLISQKNILNITPPDKEDIISVSLIAGSVIAGSADLALTGVSFSFLFSVLTAMTITYIYGASAGIAASAMITLIMAISSSCPFELMCIFASAAIFSSLNSSLKKIYFVLIFSATTLILSVYLNKSILTSENVYSFLTAALIFMLLPLKRIENIKPKPTNADEYIARLRMITTQRLKDFSSSFSKLSKTLTSLSERRTNLEKKEVSSLIDDVAAQLCVKCNMRAFCWENNFYSTYQTIFSMLSACEQKGFADENDMGDSFINSCIKKEKFLSTINRMFELHKTNMSWQNKITESRELVSQQLSGVSSIINELSNELALDITYKNRLSEKTQAILEESGFFINSIVISENSSGQTEILLKHPPCYSNKDCVKTIIPILNSTLKKHFCKECSQCITSREHKQNICTLKLIEEKRFRITPAVASTKKDGSHKSGDSTTFIPLPDGKYLLALSDGMGSGTQAQKESAATIELFEDFISAGFNKQTAVNMINSVLVLKSSQESFSTLDVCTVDMHKGEAEFIKIGAVTSFIKHENCVEAIKSNSLPVGILSKIEPDVTVKKLADSDIIVMVSDGILDSSPSASNKEGFIISLLEKISSSSPNEIADEILKAAIENSNGSVNDDMTVLAAKVFERKL